MKIIRLCYIVCLLLLFNDVTAQVTQPPKAASGFTPRYKPVYADCDSPVVVEVKTGAFYGYTVPPDGPGKKQEISGSRASTTAFEQEHNTAWYLLNISYSGELVFDILPEDSTNDYDFLLYPYSGPSFCEQLQQKFIKPVRTNIRRNDVRNKGLTGLASGAPNKLQGQGPGAQFSQSIQVKKGEQYLLVQDNVYPGGKGHRLHLYYRRNILINGKVRDEADHPIAHAAIAITAPSGETIFQAHTDDSGNYSAHIIVNEFNDYTVTASDDIHLFNEQIINTQHFRADSTILLKHMLGNIKAGGRFTARGIHFQGGSAQPLPDAYNAMHHLLIMMQQHPTVKILIEGHVTDPLIGRNRYEEMLQSLSDQRAQTVKEYLIQNGIEGSRISTIGLSNHRMIYPNAKSEAEHSANRRVEIKILSQ